MKKFEYKVATGDGPLMKADDKEEMLNEWGAMGWELVGEFTASLTSFLNGPYWIFKREIQ